MENPIAFCQGNLWDAKLSISLQKYIIPASLCYCGSGCSLMSFNEYDAKLC